jgi:hypothetical protein
MPDKAAFLKSGSALHLPGALYYRKRRGRKLRFITSGFSLQQAHTVISWEQLSPNEVVLWQANTPDGVITFEVRKDGKYDA